MSYETKGREIYDGSGNHVASAHGETMSEAVAQATLLAAAPELLAELERLVTLLETETDIPSNHTHAVLAKAKGEQ